MPYLTKDDLNFYRSKLLIQQQTIDGLKKTRSDQFTLGSYLKHLKVDINRKIPCDIINFSNEEYYSQSKEKFIKHKDMDMVHLIRSLIKIQKQQEDLIKKLIMNKVKIEVLKNEQ